MRSRIGACDSKICQLALVHVAPLSNVEQVVDACDDSTEMGARDRAIVLLLSRLGLRSGDILGLRLSDIDWAKGSLAVSGKSTWESELPLTQEIGDALLTYPKRRPAVEYGQSFHPRHRSYQAVSGTCKRSEHCEKRSSPRRRASTYPRSALAAPFRSDRDASTGCLPSGHPNRAPPSFHRDHHDLREGGRSFTEADCTTLAGGGLMLMKAVESYLAVRRAAGLQTQRCWQHAATVCSIRYGQGRVFHSF